MVLSPRAGAKPPACPPTENEVVVAISCEPPICHDGKLPNGDSCLENAPPPTGVIDDYCFNPSGCYKGNLPNGDCTPYDDGRNVVTNLAIVIMTNGIVMILANVTMEHICLIVKDQIIMVMFHITRPADVAKLSERELLIADFSLRLLLYTIHKIVPRVCIVMPLWETCQTGLEVK